MDWNLWLIDKAFLIALILIMMRVTGQMFKGMVAWSYAYVTAQLADGKGMGKAPSMKQAGGLMAWKIAPAIGDVIAAKIREWGKGGQT